MRYYEADDPCGEAWVCLDGSFEAQTIVCSISLRIEESTVLCGLGNVLLPSLEEEVSLISKMSIFAGDAAIDLEDAMLGEAASRTESVWNTRISSADGIFA